MRSHMEHEEEKEKEGVSLDRLITADDVRISIGADIEFTYEKQGSETMSEFTFDEVDISLETSLWETGLGISYEANGDKQVRVDKAEFRLGGIATWHWFIGGGRTTLPFGELESFFIEDPLVVFIGETDDEAIFFGYETENFELALGGFQGRVDNNDDMDVVASAKLRISDGWTIGISWSSDLGESVELRSLQLDAIANAKVEPPDREEEDEDELNRSLVAHRVMGWSGFISLETEVWTIYFEYITALDSFRPGLLGSTSRTPSAWNLEISVDLTEQWQYATRVESSHDLVDEPKRQIGWGTSYRITDYLLFGTEVLRGIYSGDTRNRTVVNAVMEFEF